MKNMNYMKGSRIFQLSILNTQVTSEGAAEFERLREKKRKSGSTIVLQVN